MVWNATVVVITAMVTLVALREGVRITLLRELDQLLLDDLREIELALTENESRDNLYDQLDRKDEGHARHHRWFAELVDQSGAIQYKSKHSPPDTVWQSTGDAPAQTVGAWRLLSRKLSQSGLTIRTGASLRLIREDIARLDRFVSLAAFGVFITAPLCGYWLAGRATRPLAQIISTTARLRPSQLNERLAIRGTGDELDQLSLTFNRLLDRIGKYLQDHRDSLANAAHELRTPLAAIQASIEVALSGERTNSEYRELLSDIIEEASSLRILVNQLLLLAETESEHLKLHKELVRFDELVDRSMDMFSGAAEYREITLDCEALPEVTVEGNRQHLRQVIYNLVDNALKFTRAGGCVTVSLEIDSIANQMKFAVRDNGPGISAEDLPSVFDRFFQGHRPRTGGADARGTGLGLSICRAVVQSHNGTIEVTSELGKGTQFIVTLPLATVDAGMLESQAE